LAARDWTGSAAIGTLAGWEGIVCGASAIYLAMGEVLHELAMGEVLHEQMGRTVLPLR
jgi:succinate-acetate transporter protein